MLLNAVEWINGNVFSLLLPILVFGAGIYFAVKLRFFNILHPLQILRVFFPKKSRVKERGADKKISPFKALMLALAGTLGVGNITGVAAAIMTGGCGAIFWMWCSAIAAMLVKYAEIVLAVRSRVKICDTPGKPPKYHGGAMYYIKNKHVALIFAFLCVFGSFALGNIIQIKAAADSLSGAFGIPSFAVGIVAAIACAVIIGGGVDGIADSCAFSAVHSRFRVHNSNKSRTRSADSFEHNIRRFHSACSSRRRIRIRSEQGHAVRNRKRTVFKRSRLRNCSYSSCGSGYKIPCGARVLRAFRSICRHSRTLQHDRICCSSRI